MIHPLIAMALALGLLVFLILALRFYQSHWHPHPEVPRKLLHVGMGLATLSFPWLFHGSWPVLVLAGLGVVILVLLRTLPGLKTSLGSVVGGVQRLSLGDLCFPIAVAILFVLHDHQPLLFVIPMLVLALADAVAALIGIAYGRLHYEASGGDKTAEGSLAFLTIAFLSVHVPLLLFTNTGRAETLLIALMLGLIVMLMEAIAWRGLDNLFIPLGAFVLLERYLPLGVNDLLVRLAVTICLVVLVMGFRKRSTLTHAALLGSALFGYAAFALGGILWVIPPLALFLAHSMFWPRSTANPERHDVQVVVSTAGPGLIWLTLFACYRVDSLLLPFVTLFSAHLAIIGASWVSPRGWSLARLLRLAACIVAGAAFAAAVVGLAVLLHHSSLKPEGLGVLCATPLTFLAWNLLAVGLATTVFAAILPRLIDPVSQRYSHVHHVGGTLAFLASVILACALAIGT